MDKSPSGFGARLRRLRDEKSLTLKQLAEIAGVHWNTVAKFERGDIEPSWPMVIALAKALGVDCTAFSATEAPDVPEGTPGEPAPKKRKK